MHYLLTITTSLGIPLHEYLSIKKQVIYHSHNVFLTTSYSQRLSHNVFLTTSFSQLFSHTSFSQRLSHTSSHDVFFSTSCLHSCSTIFVYNVTINYCISNVNRRTDRRTDGMGDSNSPQPVGWLGA